MKSSVRIGGALFLGIAFILGSLLLNSSRAPVVSGKAVVATAPERNPIPLEDFNNNGIADWQENLTDLGFETITVPEAESELARAEKEYVPPTSFTGKFGVALAQDFLEGKISGRDNSAELVNSAIKTIDQNTQSTQHSRIELNIIENSYDSLYTYGNQLGNLILLNSENISSSDDVRILGEALSTRNKELLSQLDPIKKALENSIQMLLIIPVPGVLANKHVELLNSYEGMLANVRGMQIAFDDPLFALARIGKYSDTLREYIEVIQSITDELTAEGIVYTSSESGAQLYLFDFAI